VGRLVLPRGGRRPGGRNVRATAGLASASAWLRPRPGSTAAAHHRDRPVRCRYGSGGVGLDRDPRPRPGSVAAAGDHSEWCPCRPGEVALDRDPRPGPGFAATACPRDRPGWCPRGSGVVAPRWGSAPPASDALSGLPNDRVGECTCPASVVADARERGFPPIRGRSTEPEITPVRWVATPACVARYRPCPHNLSSSSSPSRPGRRRPSWPVGLHVVTGGAVVRARVRPGRSAEPESELEVSPVWRAAHGHATRGAVSAPARSVGVGGGHRGPWATCRDGRAAVRAPIRPVS
jgi:hypothetical protein